MKRFFIVHNAEYKVNKETKTIYCQIYVSFYLQRIFAKFLIKTKSIDIRKLINESQIDIDFVFDKYNRIVITKEAYAKCSKSDSFDLSLGKKIAYIKAYKKAISAIRTIFNKIYVYSNSISQSSLDCCEFIDKMINAESNYLNIINNK